MPGRGLVVFSKNSAENTGSWAVRRSQGPLSAPGRGPWPSWQPGAVAGHVRSTAADVDITALNNTPHCASRLKISPFGCPSSKMGVHLAAQRRCYLPHAAPARPSSAGLRVQEALQWARRGRHGAEGLMSPAAHTDACAPHGTGRGRAWRASLLIPSGAGAAPRAPARARRSPSR